MVGQSHSKGRSGRRGSFKRAGYLTASSIYSAVKDPKSHAVSTRCIKKCHMGYCPGCSHLVAYRQGCEACNFKDEDLLQKPPTTLSSDEEGDSESVELEENHRKGRNSQPMTSAREASNNNNNNNNNKHSKRSRSPPSPTKLDSLTDTGPPKRKREGRNNQRHAPSFISPRTGNPSPEDSTVLPPLTIISLQAVTPMSTQYLHTSILVNRQDFSIKIPCTVFETF